MLLSGVALLQVQAQAQAIPAPDLVGMWSSKSQAVLTGAVRKRSTRQEEDSG